MVKPSDEKTNEFSMKCELNKKNYDALVSQNYQSISK